MSMQMGSMERIKYTRVEMLRLSSSVADKNVNLIQYSADDKINTLNKECSVDEFASTVEDLGKACRSCSSSVPKRPRTYRVVVGTQTYNFEKGVYYYCSTQMIADGNNSSPSNKLSGDEDLIVNDDVHEEEKSSDKERQNVIVDEKNSSLSKKRSGDEDFIAFDDDYEEEVISDKKRQKKIEKKRTVPRKPVQVYNLPSELPQNFQEYISGLNLEVPPLFVAQKLLTVSDINSNLGRLLLPISLVNTGFLNNFLTQHEKKLMEKTKPVEVNLVDDMMREYCSLHMTKWDMNTSSLYVLRRAWNNVVAENKLKTLKVLKDKKVEKIVGMEDDNKLVTDVVARVWAFRRGSNIWFALNIQSMTEFKVLGRTKEGHYII